MAEFRSQRFPELGFYVKGKYYQFYSGRLVTEDPDVIKAAEVLDGVVRVDKEPEPKKEPEKQSEAKPKKSAPKKKAAKTSGK